jgi:ATP-dependent DNA helicase RecQ
MYNTGLDLISGLSRLLLDDYENSDGRERLESSLKQIKNYQQDDIDFIIEQILIIGNEMTSKNKSLLAESLHKFFDNREFLFKVSRTLEDSYSMTKLVEDANIRLKTIKDKIYGGFRNFA